MALLINLWRLQMKSMTKFLLSATVALGFTTAHADMDVYVGGTVGLGVPLIQDNRIPAGPAINNGIFEQHLRHGSTSFLGGGLVGIENTWRDLGCWDLWTAVEVNLLYNSFDKKISRQRVQSQPNSVFFNVKVKNDFLYGADLKIGIPLDCYNVTPYALIGVQAGKWKTTISNGPASVSQFGIDPNSSVTYGKTRAAPSVGLGVRFRVTDCLTADLSYAYSWFRPKNKYVTPSRGGTFWTHRTRVDNNRVLLSLNFPFYTLPTCW